MANPITRRIGNSDVYCLGFGTATLGGVAKAKPESDEERLKVLDTALESGCNLWDTADSYKDSEDLIGKWFNRTGKRDEIFIASKFGVNRRTMTIDGSPEYARQQVEKSLKRLGVDYIDLYYPHRPDPKVPIELTVGALAEFVKAGKIKYIGLSECSAATLRRAHAVHPISAVQVEYSIFALDVEDPEVGLLQTARELGVTIVAYSPLGHGLLTGRYRSPDDFEDDFRKSIPRFSKENFPRILAVVGVLKRLGEKHGATSGQVALAWLLAQGPDIIPIPGTTRIEALKENAAAAKLKLSDEEVAEIRNAAEVADAKSGGARYPPGLQELLFVDTPPL